MQLDYLWSVKYMNSSIQIGILAFLLLCSSFFSASETALMSISKIRIRSMVEEEIPHAKLVEKLVQDPSKLLGAILIGNNIVNIGASSLATSLAIQYFGNAGIGIATGLMTFIVLIFGEITPKTLAAQNSEKMSLRVVRIIYVLTILFDPLLKVILKLTSWIIRLFGGSKDSSRPYVTEEELKMMVTLGQEEGVLEKEEQKMIHNVFEFGDEIVKTVMTPRIDMTALPSDATYAATLDLFKTSQYSRLPIYEGIRDNIIGIIHFKDLLFYEGTPEAFDLKTIRRQPIYTYELKNTFELFNEMKIQHIQMAIVLDEHGGTAGIVTLEDLVEEIVGELIDEYDQGEIEIKALEDNMYLASGRTRIEVINEILEVNLQSDEFDTIGGLVTGTLGRMAKVGDVLEVQDLSIEILKMQKNRILQLKIRV